MKTFARPALALMALTSFLPGCGESASQGPNEAEQQKVQAVSKELVTKYGYPTAKGPAKAPPSLRR